VERGGERKEERGKRGTREGEEGGVVGGRREGGTRRV
jgi:hypothetical protein